MMRQVSSFLLFLLVSIALSAGASLDLRSSFEWSYDTNSFSSPLPSDYSTQGYPNGGEFLKRQNLGINLGLDVYFADSSRVGLSVFTSFRFPYHAESIIPVDGENGWVYESEDSTERQHTGFFFGAGPVFCYHTERMDLLLPIRLSIGSYDWFTSGIVVGVSIEPGVSVFLTEDFFLTFSMTYDAHLMKFLFSLREVYDSGYIMLTAGASIGGGIRLGDADA